MGCRGDGAWCLSSPQDVTIDTRDKLDHMEGAGGEACDHIEKYEPRLDVLGRRSIDPALPSVLATAHELPPTTCVVADSPRAVAAARGQDARAFWAESGVARPPGLE